MILGTCTTCGGSVLAADFRDGLSRKEWAISGMCQGCQDKTFAEKPCGECGEPTIGGECCNPVCAAADFDSDDGNLAEAEEW